MAVEFWTMGRGTSGAGNTKFLDSASQATRAEQVGCDGIVYVDSQNLAGDCYVEMALAPQATSTIKLGTGVTNSFTRHPAVTVVACSLNRMASANLRPSVSSSSTPDSAWNFGI